MVLCHDTLTSAYEKFNHIHFACNKRWCGCLLLLQLTSKICKFLVCSGVFNGNRFLFFCFFFSLIIVHVVVGETTEHVYMPKSKENERTGVQRALVQNSNETSCECAKKCTSIFNVVFIVILGIHPRHTGSFVYASKFMLFEMFIYSLATFNCWPFHRMHRNRCMKIKTAHSFLFTDNSTIQPTKTRSNHPTR